MIRENNFQVERKDTLSNKTALKSITQLLISFYAIFTILPGKILSLSNSTVVETQTADEGSLLAASWIHTKASTGGSQPAYFLYDDGVSFGSISSNRQFAPSGNKGPLVSFTTI